MRNGRDTLEQLLPSNSTLLERDVLAATPFDSHLNAGADRIRLSKFQDIPDSYLPWLILEYGLGSFSQFLTDPRELLQEGLLMMRELGTVAALKRAMRWVGIADGQVIEEVAPSLHGYEYQLDIGTPPLDLSIICKLAILARLVQPVRSRLRRIVGGLNIPIFIWDNSTFEDIFDNYSGIWSQQYPGLPCANSANVWLSFRWDFLPYTEHDTVMMADQVVRDEELDIVVDGELRLWSEQITETPLPPDFLPFTEGNIVMLADQVSQDGEVELVLGRELRLRNSN